MQVTVDNRLALENKPEEGLPFNPNYEPNADHHKTIHAKDLRKPSLISRIGKH